MVEQHPKMRLVGKMNGDVTRGGGLRIKGDTTESDIPQSANRR
jgi:hypothetical protein